MFVRVRIELADGRTGWGGAAESLAPKWFDKNEALSNENNFDQLRAGASTRGRRLYGRQGANAVRSFRRPSTTRIIEAGATHDLNSFIAIFGPAQLDRAMLDALCRSVRMSFYEAMQRNFAGIAPTAGPAPDLADLDLTHSSRDFSRRTRSPPGTRSGSSTSSPATRDRSTTACRSRSKRSWRPTATRYFKLKVGGNVDDDVARLTEIAAVLDATARPYLASLDGNEQYDDLDALRCAARADECAAPRLANAGGVRSPSSSSRSTASTRSSATSPPCRVRRR